MSNDHPTTPGLPEDPGYEPPAGSPGRRVPGPAARPAPEADGTDLPPRGPSEFDSWFADEPVRPMPSVDGIPPTPHVPVVRHRGVPGGGRRGAGWRLPAARGHPRHAGRGPGVRPAADRRTRRGRRRRPCRRTAEEGGTPQPHRRVRQPHPARLARRLRRVPQHGRGRRRRGRPHHDDPRQHQDPRLPADPARGAARPSPARPGRRPGAVRRLGRGRRPRVRRRRRAVPARARGPEEAGRADVARTAAQAHADRRVRGGHRAARRDLRRLARVRGRRGAARHVGARRGHRRPVEVRSGPHAGERAGGPRDRPVPGEDRRQGADARPAELRPHPGRGEHRGPRRAPQPQSAGVRAGDVRQLAHREAGHHRGPRQAGRGTRATRRGRGRTRP
ncbi:hypothetical protein ACU686_32375 [Yinghuangia aomiensis]